MGAAGDLRRSLWARHPVVIAVVLVLTITAGAGWYARHALLIKVAAILVVEDPLEPAEMLVVSNAINQAAALEAAHLYRDGISSQIVVLTGISTPLDDEVRKLGIPSPGPTELVRAILERSGVPATAITVLADPVDGTEAEIAAVVAFARQRMPESLLFIASRSHTARVRWLLRRGLASQTRFSVRSSRFDSFVVASWWQTRDQSREVMSEYLRWFNTFFFRDAWSRPAPDEKLP
jgi:uncharacterized SAM-binding protein YcdF (DUF218 family)